MGNPKTSERDPLWAWVALAGITYSFMVLSSFSKYQGMLYVELMDVYQAGPVETSLIATVMGITGIVTSWPTGALADHFSVRVLMMVSGLLCCAGTLLAAFSNIIPLLIVSLGIIYGAAGTAVIIFSLPSISKYFKHKKTFATSIVYAGGGCATALFPIFGNYLIDRYTLRGLFLIYSGLVLNICAAGALLRPSPETQHSKPGLSCGAVQNDEKKNNVIAICIIRVEDQSTIASSNDSISCAAKVESINARNTECKDTKENSGLVQRVCTFRCIFYLAGLLFAQFGYYTCLFFLAPRMSDFGYDESRISLVLAIFGGTDAFGKLLFGYLGDMTVFDRSSLLCFALFVCGLATSFISSVSALSHIITTTVIFGLCGGVSSMYMGPLMHDILGQEHVGFGIGLVYTFSETAETISPVIGGFMKEMTGTYAMSYMVGPGAYFAAVGLCLLSKRTAGVTNIKCVGDVC